MLRIQGSRFRVQGLGFRAQGLGFGVSGSGSRSTKVQGLRFKGLRFGVSGSGFKGLWRFSGLGLPKVDPTPKTALGLGFRV